MTGFGETLSTLREDALEWLAFHSAAARTLRDPDTLIKRALDFDLSIIPDYDPDTELLFDLSYLADVTERLRRLPRKRMLLDLVMRLADGASNETEIYERLVFFTQAVSRNFMSRQPVNDDKGALIVSDPLLLLELHEMRCGHVSRLVCDLADALGWRGRLVQLGGHVAAEVMVSGQWLLIDSDIFGGGQIPTLKDGSYASIAALSEDPECVDIPFSYVDSTLYLPGYKQNPPGALPYPSYFYFSQKVYGDAKPAYLEKAQLNDETDRYFGWHNYSSQAADDIRLSDLPLRYSPGAPDLTEFTKTNRGLRLAWKPVDNTAFELSGYCVMLTGASRGWNYPRYFGAPTLQRYWAKPSPITPYIYRHFLEPLTPVFSVETRETSLEITHEDMHGGNFISIMPMEAYGLSIGRKRWNLSPEYAIPSA